MVKVVAVEVVAVGWEGVGMAGVWEVVAVVGMEVGAGLGWVAVWGVGWGGYRQVACAGGMSMPQRIRIPQRA